ncbi:MAG: hypothetical protein LBU84_16460 [Prevotella sp.]|jgi:hypothetical protein|nr:hypothetical protein [Prevotella sp.]
MKMLNSILEGTSMSKWEMNNLVGGVNTNKAAYCSCTGGETVDNINKNFHCTCDSEYVVPAPINPSFIPSLANSTLQLSSDSLIR